MEKNKKAFLKGIIEYADALKLSAVKSDIEDTLKQASLSDLSYEEFLYNLLQKEYDIRQYNLKQSRIRTASFPYKKYLEDLDVSSLPEDAQGKLKYLSSLNFIKEGQNVILSGNPGTGNYEKFLFIERFLIEAC